MGFSDMKYLLGRKKIAIFLVVFADADEFRTFEIADFKPSRGSARRELEDVKKPSLI